MSPSLADTPAAMIARLDDALSRRGEPVTLRRRAGTTDSPVNVDVELRASVRSVGAGELIGTVTQGVIKVIASPSQIFAAGWPGTAPVEGQADPRVPRPTDQVQVRGKWHQVRRVDPIFVGGVLVRIELLVAG